MSSFAHPTRRKINGHSKPDQDCFFQESPPLTNTYNYRRLSTWKTKKRKLRRTWENTFLRCCDKQPYKNEVHSRLASLALNGNQSRRKSLEKISRKLLIFSDYQPYVGYFKPKHISGCRRSLPVPGVPKYSPI